MRPESWVSCGQWSKYHNRRPLANFRRTGYVIGTMKRNSVSFVALSCVVLGGCDLHDLESSERYQSDFHYSYAMTPGSRLEVDNFNGSVEIASWDEAKCDISGVKYANSTGLRDRIKIDVQQSGGTISVRSIRPAGDVRGNMGVRYIIHVPRRVELSRIVSSNGGIKVERTEGRAELKTSNGQVRVESLNGQLTAQTSNGGVTVQDVSGNMSLRTSNGAIRAERVSAGVEASTSNGPITVQFNDKMEASSTPLKFESSNGRIDITLPAAPRSDVKARTSNSGITLRIPSEASARVKAETSHGQVKSDFPSSVTQMGRGKTRSFEGTIGSGGPLIDLHTTNGSIQLLKI